MAAIEQSLFFQVIAGSTLTWLDCHCARKFTSTQPKTAWGMSVLKFTSVLNLCSRNKKWGELLIFLAFIAKHAWEENTTIRTRLNDKDCCNCCAVKNASKRVLLMLCYKNSTNIRGLKDFNYLHNHPQESWKKTAYTGGCSVLRTG